MNKWMNKWFSRYFLRKNSDLEGQTWLGYQCKVLAVFCTIPSMTTAFLKALLRVTHGWLIRVSARVTAC